MLVVACESVVLENSKGVCYESHVIRFGMRALESPLPGSLRGARACALWMEPWREPMGSLLPTLLLLVVTYLIT